MNKINPEEPAFPTLNSDKGIQTGLSIRAHIAAMAMQGLLSNYPAQQDICNKDPRYNDKNFAEVMALNSVEFADALIEQLNK